MWKIELPSNEVHDELKALPRDQQAKFTWIAEIIREHGLENVREPYVKHLEGGLWEIRMKGREGQGRYIPRILRDCKAKACCNRQGLQKEDAENSTQRNQTCS